VRQRVSRRRIKQDPRDGDVPVGGSLRSRRLKERKIELVLEGGGVGRGGGGGGEGTGVQDHGLSSMSWLCRQQTRSRRLPLPTLGHRRTG
jgi:hypothetical protein